MLSSVFVEEVNLVEKELCERKKFVSDMFDSYSNMVFRLSFIYLKNRLDAEDAVQEVFIRLYKTQIHFNEAEHVKAWLLKVTINYCRSIIKNPWHKRVLITDGIIAAVDDEKKKNIIAEVLELPTKYRDVIYLFYYEGYSTAEISQLIKEKEPTIRTRLMRGRKLLKTQLLGGFDDEI
jgi:RNA polymerase sigma factor (sigma-70 family)